MSPFLTSLLASGTIAAVITGVFLIINNRIQLKAHQPVEDSTAEKQRMEALQAQFKLILEENTRLRLHINDFQHQVENCTLEQRGLRVALDDAQREAREAKASERILKEHLARYSAWANEHYQKERHPKVGPPPVILSAEESPSDITSPDDIT